MSKREQFEELLSGYVPFVSASLDDAFEAAIEEAYDEGYDDGTREANDLRESDRVGALSNELKARYYYLKHGGEWQLLNYGHATTPTENYVSGFEDAMRILGVKP